MEKKLLVALTTVLILVGGVYFLLPTVPTEPEETTPEVTTSLMRVAQPTLGIAFSYDDARYILSEIDPTSESDTTFQGGYTLIETQNIALSETPTEGPTAITLRVFKNTDKNFAYDWTKKHPLTSNSELIVGETSEAVVGGANGIRYRTDGLYIAENAVITHGSFVYVVSGTFISEEDTIRRDYETLLSSIAFIPEVDL